MGNSYYVVVYNMDPRNISPTRHIISTNYGKENEKEFIDWYYSEYCKIYGDKFYWANSMKEALEFEQERFKEFYK